MYTSIIESEQQIGCELSKSRNHLESGMMHFQVIWQSAMDYGTKRISIERNNSERPVDALAVNGKLLTYGQLEFKRC